MAGARPLTITNAPTVTKTLRHRDIPYHDARHQSSEISEALANDEILKSEVDILILAHHGADNGFTTTEFLKALKPKVAICAADYGNKYGHPDKVITSRLSSLGIDYYSTKTGDIIAQTIDAKHYKVSNYIANNEEKESVSPYSCKTWYISDVPKE